jgi:hypothetical protein
MRDSIADIDAFRSRNQARGLDRALIPELRRRGYRFVQLDAVPQVAQRTGISTR